MTNAPSGSILVVVIFAWAIYRRVRRNIGRQTLRPGRIIFRIGLLSLVALFILAVGGLFAPVTALAFGGGALLGAAAALLGLRHTKFEMTAEGHYYTPNTYIGMALSLLLLGRMAYRMFLLPSQAYQDNHPQAFQSPLTNFIIGITLGYYLAYSIGLLVHTRDQR